jgi:formylglycine-generating enzyme required for sulfatase activity
VTLAKGFYMQTTEVTNAQFVVFLNDVGRRGTKSRPWFETKREDSESHIVKRWDKFFVEKNYKTHPALQISWYGATAFANWLSRKEGRTYRLPAETEWEYACRAGSTTAYFWGDTPDAACTYANLADQTVKRRFPKWPVQDCDDGYVYTAPVGSFRPNAFGLYDMLGNTWEWCRDWYDRGKHRVLRGASWGDNAGRVRCANRGGNAPASRSNSVGFRLVAALPR